jgi:hypothetical protein
VLHRIVAFIVAMGVTTSLVAQGSYDRFLVPIATARGTSGALSSSWVALTWIKNDSGLTLDFDVPRGCVFECLPQALQPNETRGIELSEPPDNPGFIMHIQQPTDRVWFYSRVYDQTRQSQTYGTEVPIVRENAFYDRTFVLPVIPTDQRFRVLLRIYDIDGRSDGVVTVRALDPNGPTVWGSIDVTLQRPATAVTPSQNKPSYAQISLPGAFPSILNSSGVPKASELNIEITPKTSGLRVWAFASVTHNETQHVTTVTPH